MPGRHSGASDFNQGEVKFLSPNMRTGQDLIKLQIPPDFVKRTFWGLHVPHPAGASTDWFVDATLRLWYQGGIVGEWPFCAGNSTAVPSVLPRSLISILVPNGGTTPVGRSIFVAVNQPITGESQFYYLSPYDAEIYADLVTLSINSFANVDAIHSILAVQSTSLIQ